jgi:hypothetical protein
MKKLVYQINYYKSIIKIYLKSEKSDIVKQNFLDLGILDSTISSSNLGDLIIFESVIKNIREVFKNDFLTTYPTQIHTSKDAKYLMSQKRMLFVTGTNLLSSNFETRYQWKINYSYKKFLENKVVLVGVGWWQYQGDINKYTSKIYNSILTKNLIHSVRDDYSVEKLNSIGIKNVVNTSCPTLWNITPMDCLNIPTLRAKSVATTLTFYKKNIADDLKMLKILSGKYDKVYLWIQSFQDLYYLEEIHHELKNIELIPPTIEAFDSLLKRGDVDYIGTRLHAGIRAIQNGIRTLILAVDNRAVEIARNINLNVIKRENVDAIQSFIDEEYITNLVLPIDNIELFKKSLHNFRNENTVPVSLNQ